MKFQTNHFLGILAVSLALLVPPGARAGGTVNYGNNSSTKVINGQSSAPVTTNDNIQAALYWSPDGFNAFVPIGAAVTVGIPAPGLFVGGTRTTGAATPGGSVAQFQVRAWGGGYANYEAALHQNGVLVGQSAIFSMPTGNPGGTPPTPPESLLATFASGLTSFTLTPNPQLTGLVSNPGNGFKQISGLGGINLTYGIESATNLNFPIFWQRIGSNTANGLGLFQFTDTNAPAFPMRFYRAVFP